MFTEILSFPVTRRSSSVVLRDTWIKKIKVGAFVWTPSEEQDWYSFLKSLL